MNPKKGVETAWILLRKGLVSDELQWRWQFQGIHSVVGSEPAEFGARLRDRVTEAMEGRPKYRIAFIDDMPAGRARARELQRIMGSDWQVVGVDLTNVSSKQLADYKPIGIVLDRLASGESQPNRSDRLLIDLRNWDPTQEVCTIVESVFGSFPLPVAQDNVKLRAKNALSVWRDDFLEWRAGRLG